MKDHVNAHQPASHVRTPGRPSKPDAKTPAQRAKAYRDRQKACGLRTVKCALSPEAIAYLEALREIHGVTISEAISMAVMAVIRGEPLPLR
jgi:hypothetical protein